MAIITISRQVGSFGDKIAAVLANKMNYELITRDKIYELSLNYSRELANSLQLFETEMPPNYLKRYFCSNRSLAIIFEALILQISSGGNCIIVGRGANIVLNKIPCVLKTRVITALDLRVKRVSARLGWGKKRALHHVIHLDHQREVLIKLIYQKDIADPVLYDLVLNTENLDIDASIEIIFNASAKMFNQYLEENSLKELKNRALAKRVESEIEIRCANALCQPLEVTASERRIVAISGYVRYKDFVDEIERIAAGVPGVVSVENNLKFIATRL